MNYKTAYKKLNQNGVIDEIINREVGTGEKLDMVKYEIIDSIKSYIAFTKSSTFKGMTYWQTTQWVETDNQKLHHRISNEVSKELALIEIAECAVFATQLKYMIDVQRNLLK